MIGSKLWSFYQSKLSRQNLDFLFSPKFAIDVHFGLLTSLLNLCLRVKSSLNKKVNFLFFYKVSRQIYSQWNRLEESWGLQMFQTQVKKCNLFNLGEFLFKNGSCPCTCKTSLVRLKMKAVLWQIRQNHGNICLSVSSWAICYICTLFVVKSLFPGVEMGA